MHVESVGIITTPAEDTTYVYNLVPGDYYLKVTAANLNSWEIVVEAYIPP